MTRDIAWDIGQDPAIPANGKTGAYADVTRGDTVRFDFFFDSQDDLSQSDSLAGAYGGEFGHARSGVLGGSRGASAFESRLAGHPERYLALREYLDYAGNVARGTDINGVPWYRERTPPDDPVDTHVVAIRPGDDVREHPGVWGLIIGGRDSTELVQAQARLRFEVFILAEFDEYANLDAVEEAFKRPP